MLDHKDKDWSTVEPGVAIALSGREMGQTALALLISGRVDIPKQNLRAALTLI